MIRLVIPGLLLTAMTVYAGEAVITETPTGIRVEYTGTQVDKEPVAPAVQAAAGTEAKSPAPPANPGQVARARFLAAQIQQLTQEAKTALKLTGTESDEELAAKNALSEQKQSAADRFTAEYTKLTGSAPPPPPPPQAADAAADTQQSPYIKQRNDREERIRRTREARRGAGSDTTPAQ